MLKIIWSISQNWDTLDAPVIRAASYSVYLEIVAYGLIFHQNWIFGQSNYTSPSYSMSSHWCHLQNAQVMCERQFILVARLESAIAKRWTRDKCSQSSTFILSKEKKEN